MSRARFAPTTLDRAYASAVDSTIKGWTSAQGELKRLLQRRIDGLLGKLRSSLLLIGTLSAFSIVVAVMTHRYIVRPLRRLEGLAKTVRETKDYTRRIDHDGQDEIGRLAAAFNEMLAELAASREREVADRAQTAAIQSELARAARLAAMGQMAASIAHEVNQPLTAIVATGNAGVRKLANPKPDLEDTKAAFLRIVAAGHRASSVITTIRGMFKKDGGVKICLDVNDLIREVLKLVQDELQSNRISVRIALIEGLPLISADRVQLQLVMRNLIMNSIEAMTSIADRARILRVRSEICKPSSVLVTIEDSGIGIDPQNIDHIFEAFYTTKSHGMGMGLSICRSIVEAHDGSLTASRAHPYGSVFQLALPAEIPGGGERS